MSADGGRAVAGGKPSGGFASPRSASTVTLSFGRNVRDVHPIARTMTFDELVKEFSVPDTKRSRLTSAQYHALDKKVQHVEKDGRYFSVTTYRQGGTRREDDIDVIHGIALDFDSGWTKKPDIRETLGGSAYVAYTSFSHRPEKERWRAYIPFMEPIDREQFKVVFEHFQFLFGGDLDERCKVASQLWYTPACPHDAEGDFQCFYEVGELFDAKAVKPIAKRAKQKPAKPAAQATKAPAAGDLTRLKSALKHIDPDERQTWIEVGLAVKHDLGEAGLQTWLEWSAGSPKFDEEEAHETWESFKDRESGSSVVTLGSVFFKAKQAGWVDDAVPDYIAKMNEEYFVAPIGRNIEIFHERIDPATGYKTADPMGREDFNLKFENKFALIQTDGGRIKKVNIGAAWRKHPQRLEYEGVVLAPNRNVPGCYNRWRGFTVEPKMGSRKWRRMRWHILFVICAGSRRLYRYVLGWLAFCVQRPGERAEVVLVLQGGRGTGKGVFIRPFGKLFGQHFRQINHPRHLTGHFNAPLADCLFLYVDEAFWAGDKAGESVFKGTITEPTITIERKGIDPEDVPNMLKIIMASNNDWVVPAGMDERRFCVLAVSNMRQQDTAYFAQLQHEIDNGGVEAMLHDLQVRDLSRFDIRKVPNTEALKAQKILSMSPEQRWFMDKLTAGEWSEQWGGATRLATIHPWHQVPKDVVHDDYVRALQKSGVPRRSTQTELGMALRKLSPSGWPRTSGLTTVPGGNQVDHYLFPPLADCRTHFEKLARLDGYEWP